MATPEKFEGCNRALTAPEGKEDSVQTLHVYNNGVHSVSKWRFTVSELREIERTGCIYVSVMHGKSQPPIFVGSEQAIRDQIADIGVWKK
jgi:hypothetical protein